MELRPEIAMVMPKTKIYSNSILKCEKGCVCPPPTAGDKHQTSLTLNWKCCSLAKGARLANHFLKICNFTSRSTSILSVLLYSTRFKSVTKAMP